MAKKKPNVIQRLKFAFSNEYSLDRVISDWLSGNDISYASGTVNVTTDQAMRLMAVYSCVRVLSETIGCIPLFAYQNKGGKREPAKDSNLYKIFHTKPNKVMSPMVFKETMTVALCLYGNAYAWKRKNQIGDLIGLEPILPSLVKIKVDNYVPKYIIKTADGDVEKTRDDIFHIVGMSYDGIIGLSPIEYAARAAGLGLEYERYSQEFYKNGALTSGTIEFPSAMGDEAFKRFKEDFKSSYQGLKNAGVPIILEDGGKFNPITVNAADAQFIENRKFQKEEIASIFRVPMHLIQSLDRSTNNNIEHQSLEFIKYTMLPWFVRWEEAIETQLLTDKQLSEGYYMEFNAEMLQRGDFKSRMEGYEVAVRTGIRKPSEIRELENLEYFDETDQFFISQNLRGIEEPAKSATQGGN